MRVLTFHPEWLWAILYLDKDVENRVWKPPEYMVGKEGFSLALHAGQHIGGTSTIYKQQEALVRFFRTIEECGWKSKKVEFKTIFLKDDRLVEFYPLLIQRSKILALTSVKSVSQNYDSPWAIDGQYHWELGEKYILKNPVETRGHQRLWHLPEFARSQIVKELQTA